ncbi:MAG TPA: hypothetical protein VJZ71_13575 [Phycisphaerae bacterium]|nr:hypothetical protein [Phycisphaerae bacterium]
MEPGTNSAIQPTQALFGKQTRPPDSMGSDSKDRRHLFPFLRHFHVPLIVFGGGFLASELPDFFFSSARGYWYATLLAWRLGPWSRFPIPFDSSVFEGTGINMGESWVGGVGLALVAMFTMGLILSGLHACLFFSTFAIYRRFGWPPYLGDIRERLSSAQLWKTAIRRSWWVLPLFGTIGSVWSWFSYGQAYAQMPLSFTALLLNFALLALAVLSFLRIAKTTLVTSVQASLLSDELRCVRCSYMLRGLPGSICPECGSKIVSESPPRFGILRFHSRKLARIARFAWLLTVTLVVFLPTLELALLTVLPFRIGTRLPLSLQSLLWVRSPYECPVKPGTFCILRRDQEVAAFWIAPRKGLPSDLHWWYWEDLGNWGQNSPNMKGSIKINQMTPLRFTMGPCAASISFSMWQYQWWEWLLPVAAGWRVEVVPSESAPLQLRVLRDLAETKAN